MNDSNPLETLLQSWTPRRPSAELKERIFSADETAASEPRHKACGRMLLSHFAGLQALTSRIVRASEIARWLAPAAACSLTFMVLFGANNLHYARAEGDARHPMFAMTSLTISNRGATLPAKWLGLTKTDLNLEFNAWSGASFDWTNQGQFLSTNRSMPVGKTNFLLQ